MNCPTCNVSIDEHPANRCLDAWCAEKVMEIKRIEHRTFTDEWIYWERTDPSDAPAGWHDTHYPISYYSTTIFVAWGVLEKFRRDGKEWELVIGLNNYTISNMSSDGQFLNGWTYNDGIILVDAPTAPLAISRAALKAALHRDKEKP